MNVLQSLPSDLGSKANSNDLNVSVPVAAAAAFQISTNFLNSVSNIHTSTFALILLFLFGMLPHFTRSKYTIIMGLFVYFAVVMVRIEVLAIIMIKQRKREWRQSQYANDVIVVFACEMSAQNKEYVFIDK